MMRASRRPGRHRASTEIRLRVRYAVMIGTDIDCRAENSSDRQDKGLDFIVMEYLEGDSLLAVLLAGRDGKRLDVLSTGCVIANAAEGLHAVHAARGSSSERLDLVHHDISLGNIMVLYNGQVKRINFGFAATGIVFVAATTRPRGKKGPKIVRGPGSEYQRAAAAVFWRSSARHP